MFGVRATSALKAALSAPANALIDTATHLPRRVQGIVRRDVSIGARFLPYEPDADAWVLPLSDGPPPGRALPVPPQELWLGYGRTPEEYLAKGKRDVDKMQEVLAKADVELAACPRILDLVARGPLADPDASAVVYLRAPLDPHPVTVSNDRLMGCIKAA